MSHFRFNQRMYDPDSSIIVLKVSPTGFLDLLSNRYSNDTIVLRSEHTTNTRVFKYEETIQTPYGNKLIYKCLDMPGIPVHVCVYKGN